MVDKRKSGSMFPSMSSRALHSLRCFLPDWYTIHVTFATTANSGQFELYNASWLECLIHMAGEWAAMLSPFVTFFFVAPISNLLLGPKSANIDKIRDCRDYCDEGLQSCSIDSTSAPLVFVVFRV
ncbi:hypothetical protein PMAYCL1PPCAC_20507, partial [Pristionchus mayeri]